MILLTSPPKTTYQTQRLLIEVLRNTLSYKNKRTMSFEKFLTNMQAMFTGFEDNNEVLTNAQKVRLLFQKVQCSNLTQVKSALQVQSNLDVGGDTVTYDFIANSLAAEAAALPDYVPNRQASGVESKGSAPVSGIKTRRKFAYCSRKSSAQL